MQLERAYHSRIKGFKKKWAKRIQKRKDCLLVDTVVIWHPWIDMAWANRTEAQVWPVIFAAIDASDGIILDLDGGEESPGMKREREYAESKGKKVEVIS